MCIWTRDCSHHQKRQFVFQHATATLVQHDFLVEGYQDNLREQLRPFLGELRDCYEYRLLRDWGYGRPWRKLYVFLSENHFDVDTKTVDMIRAVFHKSQRANNLFDVHPVILGEDPFKG